MHGCLCRVKPPSDVLQKYGIHMVTGGIVCADFSSIGLREGFGGSSTKASLSFRDTFVADDVSLGLIECAPEWKPDMFDHKAFNSTHSIFQCLPYPCPSSFYWPFTRKRWWGIVVRRDRRLVKDWQTFVAPFQQIAFPFPGGGTGPLSGHSLFCDSRERVQAELIEAAKRQRATILPGEKLNYEDHALNNSQANHLRLFRGAHEEWKRKLSDRQKEIPEGAKDLMADLEHNPDSRPRFSTRGNMPGLLSHAAIWSGRFGRLLSKRETLLMQAWPTIPNVHGDDTALGAEGMAAIQAIVDELSPSQTASLGGMGMHLNILMLVIAWALACTEPIAEHPVGQD